MFVHIPKTGGTTLRYVFYDHFDNRRIYPNAYEYFVLQRGRLLSWDSLEQRGTDRLAGKRLLIGHFGLDAPDALPERPAVCTMFREPGARILSTVRYFRDRGRLGSDAEIDGFLDRQLAREGRLQAVRMGYRPGRGNLEQTLERISALDCFGISEQFERSLQLFNRSFGWTLRNIPRRNVSRHQPRISQEQMARIRDTEHVDRVVHAHALRVFEERCARYGI